MDCGDYFLVEGDIKIPKSNPNCDVVINSIIGSTSKGNISSDDGHKLKWTASEALSLSYNFFGNLAFGIYTHDEVKDIINEALATWSGITYVNFEEIESEYCGDILFFQTDLPDDGTLANCEYHWTIPDYNLTRAIIAIDNDSDFLNSRQRALDTFIHEIGHALGLAHEHQRTDSPYQYGQGTEGIPYGTYDPQSIMNYGSDRDGKISLGDIRTIRYLYGYPSTTNYLILNANHDNTGRILIKNFHSPSIYLIDRNHENYTIPYHYKHHVQNWICGDFSGSGNIDLRTKFTGIHKVYISELNNDTLCGTGSCYDGDYDVQKWIVGDFDGDGDDEARTKFAGLKKVYISNDDVTSLTNGGASCYDGNYDIQTWIVGDFNGDGADEVRTKFSGLTPVYISNPGVTNLGGGGKCYNGDYHINKWAKGDFDGDGDDEIISAFQGLTKIYMSDDEATNLCVYDCYNGDYYVDNWIIADIDNDGDDDIITKFIGINKYYLNDGINLCGNVWE